MLNLTYKDKPDYLEYFNNLSVDRKVFFDKQKVLNTIIFEQALADTELDLSIDSLATGLGEGCLYVGDIDKFGGSKLSRELIMQYLLQEVGKRTYLLKVHDKDKGGDKYSLDKNNVLKPLLEMGIASEFLSEFILYREHKKAAGDMSKRVIERFSDTDVEGVSSLNYSWTKAFTGRLYTNNDNIQNIAKLYLSAMMGKSDDYLLVWGDFDQIDLRVAYHTIISESSEDDEIFNKYDDKYEAVARIIDKKLGREFNLEKFKENRKRYKKGILARCYGQSLSRLTKEVGDKDFAVMLDEYYKSNKRYMNWYYAIDNIIKSGDESVDIYTYFGNKCHVGLTDCKTYDQKLDRLLNCPIQSTSNDIVMHMVNRTVAQMRLLGVPEEMFRVYMVRHDEPIFMIHKSVLEHLPVIRKNTVVQIDDWGPVTMSLEIGKYYSVNEYDKYAEYFGGEDVTKGVVVSPRSSEYHPLYCDEGIDSDVVVTMDSDSVLTVDGRCFNIDTNKHIKYQVHNILADYTKEKGVMSSTFKIIESEQINKLDLKNIYIDGVHIYFKR